MVTLFPKHFFGDKVLKYDDPNNWWNKPYNSRTWFQKTFGECEYPVWNIKNDFKPLHSKEAIDRTESYLSPWTLKSSVIFIVKFTLITTTLYYLLILFVPLIFSDL